MMLGNLGHPGPIRTREFMEFRDPFTADSLNVPTSSRDPDGRISKGL